MKNHLILLLVSFLHAAAFAQQFAWEPQTSGTTSALEAVTFVNPNQGWIVGGNKGVPWQMMTSGISDGLLCVAFADANTGWAGGWSGKLLKTTDGGNTWALQNSGTTSSLYSMFFLNASTGWAVGSNAILRTTNGGNTWLKASGSYPWLYSVFFVDANTGWVSGMNGAILKTTNGGANWTAQTSGVTGTLYGISFVDANTGWAVGSAGTVLKTTNGGATWTPQTSNTTNDMESVTFVDANHGWAAGDRATIIRTTDGGTTWTMKTELIWPPYDLHGIKFVDANNGCAVGTFGTIFKTTDGGENWRAQNSGTTSWLYGIALLDDHTGWAVGNSGTILRTSVGAILTTSNGGANWQTQISGTSSTLRCVCFADATTGWIAGSEGVLLKTDNAGAQWSKQNSGTFQNLHALDFINANAGWGVGENGTILHTSDGGVTWSTQTSGTTRALYAVNFFDSNIGWAVGNSGILLKTSNGGQAWQQQVLPAPNLYDIAVHDANTLWLAGSGGVILHSTDGGATWRKQTSGTTEDLQSLTFLDANLGWGIGNKGIILKTTNGGDIWVQQTSGTSKDLYGVTAMDAMHVVAVGDSGVVLASSQNEDRQAPSLTIDQPQPGQVFTLNQLPIIVSGTASDEHGVTLKIGAEAWPLISNAYSYSLYLPAGPHVIRVQAADAAGNLSVAEVNIEVQINLPSGEMQYYLTSSGSNSELSFSPMSATVTSETYYGSWTREFVTTLTGYVNGNEYDYRVRLASGSGSMPITLSWFVERESRRELLATTTFPISSNVYTEYNGTATGAANLALPGHKLIFEVSAIAPGGMRWGGGSSGSAINVPGGLTLPPAAPQLLSPANAAVEQPRDLTLSWSAVGSATKYHLQVATDSLFVSKIVDNANLATTALAIGPLAGSTTHYWRVRASNEGGPSFWSSAWHFTTIMAAPAAPTLLSPADGATNTTIAPSLTWNATSGAASYHLQVATQSSFATTVIDESGLTNSSFAVSGLAHSTVYYWRINATNAGGTSPWSNTWHFTTIVAAPAAPTLASPSPDAVHQPVTLTLSWNPAERAEAYHLQVAVTSDFATTIVNDSTLITNVRQVGPLQHNTSYYWRVRAKNLGGVSAFSEVRRFTTIMQLPAAVQLLMPAHGAMLSADTVRCLWRTSAPAVQRYWFEWATDSLMQNATRDTSFAANDTTITLRQLGSNQNYWWRVKARNIAGWGEFSAKRKFTVIISGVAGRNEVPLTFYLAQNYPNPARPRTEIRFQLPQASAVRLSVYNVLSQEICRLVEAKFEAGYHNVHWNGTDGNGNPVPSGIYFYQLRAGEFSQIRKMSLVR